MNYVLYQTGGEAGRNSPMPRYPGSGVGLPSSFTFT